eukprot:Selendium_serpulae@DN6354_c0_g1_i11.p1
MAPMLQRQNSREEKSLRTSAKVLQRRELLRTVVLFTVPFVAWMILPRPLYWLTSFLISLCVFFMDRVRLTAKVRFPFLGTLVFLYSTQLLLLSVFTNLSNSENSSFQARSLRHRSMFVNAGASTPKFNHGKTLHTIQRPYRFSVDTPRYIEEPEFIESFYQPHQVTPLKTISVILAAFNEHKYIQRTLESIVNATHPSVLKEIIIVDDASEPPMITAYDTAQFPPPLVKVMRHDKREGLIRSKKEGGDADPGWAIPVLRHINTNYKRVVVPTIPMLDGDTWTVNRKAVGIKMMFEWDLAFHWFDDGNDWVPCMSGGLLAMSKDWWTESGTLDEGMLQWGGENIEQSIRVWLCGGEIVVARDSIIAHVFRDKFPYPIDNSLIMRNKVRTVEGWWDDESKERFYKASPYALNFKKNIGDLSSRQEIKDRLNCKPFEWYIERFGDVFHDRGMLAKDTFQIRNADRNVCLKEGTRDKGSAMAIVAVPCAEDDDAQRWNWRFNGTALQNFQTNNCLDAANPHPGGMPFGAKSHIPRSEFAPVNKKLLTFRCEKDNHNQYWIADGGRLVHSSFCTSFIPPRHEGPAPPDFSAGATLFHCGRDENNQLTTRGIPIGQRFELANHQNKQSPQPVFKKRGGK